MGADFFINARTDIFLKAKADTTIRPRSTPRSSAPKPMRMPAIFADLASASPLPVNFMASRGRRDRPRRRPIAAFPLALLERLCRSPGHRPSRRCR
ncbi:hypothetical protein [Allosphingosinicella sp.]|uniref:hypothetical protein n=1 Tax=Allosphingosinicella sp. TaxID=2823234 RepID=UPI003784959A